MFRVEEIYAAEGLEQRPPWMAPRPLARLRYQMPRSAERLAELVKKQVSGGVGGIIRFYFLLFTYCPSSNIFLL